MTSSPLFVGIDVAKATLDIALRPSEQLWQIIYGDTHVAALVIQLSELSPTLIVVEATGSTAGLSLAMESIRPRGTLVLKSTVARTHTLSLAPLVINEITVVGSRCGRFPPALQALAHGHVTVAPLIDQVYPLAAGVQALAHAARPGTRKILLRMF